MNLITICILLTLSGISIAQQDEVCVSKLCNQTGKEIETENKKFDKHIIPWAELISSSIDQSVKPCDDFYQYSCGAWIKNHPINTTEGLSHFIELNHEMGDSLLKLLSESTVENEPKYLHPLINFFKGCVNTNNRNLQKTRDFDLIKAIIKQIGGWPLIDTVWNESSYTYENAFIQINKLMLSKLILDIEVGYDLKNHTKPIISVVNTFIPATPGIEGIYRMPKEEDTEEKIYTYYAVVKSPAQQVAEALKGTTIADTLWATEIKEVQALEIALKNITSHIHNRDYIVKNYDKLKIHAKDLAKFPEINLRKIVEGILMSENIVLHDNDAIFADTEFLEQLGSVLHKFPKRAFANFIATNIAMILAKHTTTPMAQILGTPNITLLPRQCLAFVEQTLPDLIGRYFLDKKFAKESVKDMKDLITIIKEAFHQILQENTWMDETTKANSIKKLNAISEHIAFPEFLSNDAELQQYYSQLSNISENTFLDTIIKTLMRQRTINLQPLKETAPPKGHWPLNGSPVVINAFYNPEYNGICATFNLGAIGMVIAHELTHAYDNIGSLFDERGDLANWMTNKSRTTFNEKEKCFADQYNLFRYNIGNNIFVNISGSRTLGENIADNGGVRIAYRALELHKAKSGGKLQKLPGTLSTLSPEQIFFLTFANLWCANRPPMAISNQIARDPHSIENARVIGTLSNFNEFAKAFNCPIGSKMNPTHKCLLW